MKQSIMQQAQGKAPKAGGFKRPDIKQFTPPEARDTVDRVVAAGVKLIYSPEMREEVMQAVQSQDPTPKKMADNVTGLLLALDQQAQGGIPEAAIFPAGMELLGEAAEVLEAAGQPVSQEDFNEAALMLFVAIGQKLGHSQDELMGAASQAVPGGGAEPEAAEQPAEPGPRPPMPAGAMA